MGTSSRVTKECTHSSVRRTFISVHERRFWTFLIDVPGSLNNCYIGYSLDVGHIDLPKVSMEMYKAYEGVE